MNKQLDYDKLCDFFNEVSELTSYHTTVDGFAVVFAKSLGEALARVDPKWWERCNDHVP